MSRVEFVAGWNNNFRRSIRTVRIMNKSLRQFGICEQVNIVHLPNTHQVIKHSDIKTLSVDRALRNFFGSKENISYLFQKRIRDAKVLSIKYSDGVESRYSIVFLTKVKFHVFFDDDTELICSMLFLVKWCYLLDSPAGINAVCIHIGD